jgi:hypothetical protein
VQMQVKRRGRGSCKPVLSETDRLSATIQTDQEESEIFIRSPGVRDRHSCTPAAALAALLLGDDLSPPDKGALWVRLLPYLYPQLRPIDPEGYLTVEQASQMLSAVAAQFRRAITRHVADPALVGRIVAEVRQRTASLGEGLPHNGTPWPTNGNTGHGGW